MLKGRTKYNMEAWPQPRSGREGRMDGREWKELNKRGLDVRVKCVDSGRLGGGILTTRGSWFTLCRNCWNESLEEETSVFPTFLSPRAYPALTNHLSLQYFILTPTR